MQHELIIRDELDWTHGGYQELLDRIMRATTRMTGIEAEPAFVYVRLPIVLPDGFGE